MKNKLESDIYNIYKRYDGCEDNKEYYNALKEEVGSFKLLVFDWKEISDNAVKQIVKTMIEAGLFVVYDPSFDGTDTYGILIFHPVFEEEWA